MRSASGPTPGANETSTAGASLASPGVSAGSAKATDAQGTRFQVAAAPSNAACTWVRSTPSGASPTSLKVSGSWEGSGAKPLTSARVEGGGPVCGEALVEGGQRSSAVAAALVRSVALASTMASTGG